jgi:heptosyltransferase II
MKSKDVRKILVIGHSNIGDACCDLVVVDPLRKAFPAAKISFLTSSIPKNIVEGYKDLDQLLTYDRHGADKGAAGMLRLVARLRKERFDLVVVLKDTWLGLFLGAKDSWSVRRYLGGPPEKKKKHIADIYLEFLRFYGVEAKQAAWNFDIKGEKEFCDRFLSAAGVTPQDKIVGILPYSGWSLKDWPVEKWNELGCMLQKQGIKLIAFGKPAPASEAPLSGAIISALGKTTLKQALALIRRCNLFVGVDSSLLHLSSSMGVEAIGLYGATSKDYIYPYFHYQNIVEPSRKPSCLPCYPGLKNCPCMKNRLSHSPCMKAISAEEVAAAVMRKLF